MLRWSLLLLLLLAVAPTRAAAQGCGGRAGRAEAAAVFEAAGRAAAEERWEESRAEFERAYALSCAPSALYNQAVALRQLRRYAEAVEVLRRFFADHSDVGQGLLASAQDELRETESRVARLEVTVGPGELLLDGQPIDPADDGLMTLVVNPGPHSLRLERAGGSESWQGTLTEGQTAEVTLQVIGVERESPPQATPVRTPEGGAGSISAGGPVFLALGGATGAAAAIVGILALTRNDELRGMCAGTACPPASQGLADEVRTLSLVTDILWPAAVTLGAVGLIWLIVDAASGGGGETEISCLPTGCGAAF